MAQRIANKTTFEAEKTIEPIYSGGGVALSQDGRVLVTCLGEDALLTDLATGDRLARVEGDGGTITTLSLTPSASHLVICSRSLSMRIYALQHFSSENRITAVLFRVLKPHSSPAVTSEIDRSGTLLATGGADGTIKVWDIHGGYATHTLHGHSGVVSALSFFELKTAEEDPGTADTGRQKSTGQNSEPSKTTRKPQKDSQRGYRLASGSDDGQIRIWNLESRKCVAVLHAHVSVVRSLDFDEKEGLLVSASRDKTAMLWDAKSWKMKSTFPALEAVEAAGFLQEGSLVYTGGESGRVRLWHVHSGLEVTKTQVPGRAGQAILDVLYYSSLPFLLSVHADQTLVLHAIDAMHVIEPGVLLDPLPVLRHISGTHDEVTDIAFIGDNRSMLAVATNHEEIKLLSIEADAPQFKKNITAVEGGGYFGSDVAVLSGHEDIIISLDADWSGHWLATGAKDDTARLWRIDPTQDSYICFATFTGHAGAIAAVALPQAVPLNGSPAHTDPLSHPPAALFTGSQDLTVKRWKIPNFQKDTQKTARAIYTRKAHDKDINAVDINHNTTLFASASQDRTVKIWSAEDGEAVGVLRGHRRGVWSVKFATKDIPPISGHGGQLSGARGLILTGSGDRSVKIWSLNDYSCLRTFDGHTGSVLKVLWMLPTAPTNENGRENTKRAVQVASAGGDGLVKVWDANTGELECTLDNHSDRVWALAVDASTNGLVSGGADGVITFWKDTTTTTVAAAVAASTERIEQDQQLQNYIRAGSYRSAITLALQLNHPARLLALFASAVSTYPPEEGSLCGVKAVDDVLASLGDEQLFTLLCRVRDWNTNAKTAIVAQRVLWTLLKSYPVARFEKLRASSTGSGKGTNVKDVLDALRTYTERHYRKMEDLIDESYLVEYTLREMDDIGLVEMKTNGIHANGVGLNGHQEDIVMLD